ncbi:MAG: hypothetical protein NTW06_03995 [Candidatus Falkowbacteria bacterium]|nr:hypothetical protein [Candidatus Falkowbacteria bacterium]
MDNETAKEKYLAVKELFRRMRNEMGVVIESYYIWRTLTFSRSIPEVGQEKAVRIAKLMSSYKDFFVSTEQSHLQTFIIGLMKFFDNDPRTLSIKNLIKEIQANEKIFTPEVIRAVHPDLEAIGAVTDDYIPIDQDTVEQIENTCQTYATLIENLKDIRDKQIAHTEIKTMKVTFVPNEIEALIKAIQEMFNKLSGKFDLSSTILDHLQDDAIRSTKFMLENLERGDVAFREEIKKKWGSEQN